MRFSPMLCAVTALFVSTAQADTQTTKQGRVRYALIMTGAAPAHAELLRDAFARVLDYDTAAELLAATPNDGVLGYALDTDAAYLRANSSWVALASGSGILGSNGGTIDNETNNVWTLAENSENITLTFGTDTVTFASGTSATFVIDEDVTVGGYMAGRDPFELLVADDTPTVPDECGKWYASATDGVFVVLPAVSAANAGCCFTLQNTAADDAALVGFSVDASDAVFGTIANASSDAVASGTDDQAWSNTKTGANQGDWSTVCSDGVTGYFVRGGVGVWSSQAQ